MGKRSWKEWGREGKKGAGWGLVGFVAYQSLWVDFRLKSVLFQTILYFNLYIYIYIYTNQHIYIYTHTPTHIYMHI